MANTDGSVTKQQREQCSILEHEAQLLLWWPIILHTTYRIYLQSVVWNSRSQLESFLVYSFKLKFACDPCQRFIW